MPKKIVYMYSEVMPYTIAVMNALVKEFDAIIHCICWDEQKRSPFIPENSPGICFYKRSGFNREKLVGFISEVSPDIIYVSGRMDKLYLSVARYYKKKNIKIVTGSDNQWAGSVKDRIAALFSRLLYRRYFEYMWVAGIRQYEFARRMGYKNNQILKFLYSAETNRFNEYYAIHRQQKQNGFPHTIVFVGRFIEIKGISLLIQAFNQIKENSGNDWQLILVGGGDIAYDTGKDYIHVKNFMSSEALANESSQWGVFCLPSLREPWGVVVHEFAALGLPVISSDSVGAADAFVIDDYNGYIFDTGNVTSLKNALQKIMSCSDKELLEMGSRSNEMAREITPQKAAYSLMSIVGLNK